MYTPSFCRYPIIILISVIYSSGSIVTSSSSQLEKLFCSLVLEAPLVGSNFLESFVHASLSYPYILDFVFASSTI